MGCNLQAAECALRYTMYNFVPINIYHQLSKTTNMFFLVTLALLSVPSISPFTPYTYMIAFLCVLGVSMAKDGYEDYKRHKHDKEFNQRPTHLVKPCDGGADVMVEETFMENLNAGDFAIVKADCEVPADMVFLSSKVRGEDGGLVCARHCYVETSNLDGELNYKRKTAHGPACARCGPKIVRGGAVICGCDMQLIGAIGSFTVFDTGEVLSEFECQIATSNENIMQYERNVLLRGSRLRNTEQIFGLVVSVGEKTKLSMSSRRARTKMSAFERRLFRKIFYVFLIYFTILVISSLLGARFLVSNDTSYLYTSPYPARVALQQTGTEFILYNYLVPISLFVTFEFVRFIQGLFINNDQQMTVQGVGAQCQNTGTIEDLGIIECILADKTGTLTKNEMVFRYVHLLGESKLCAPHALWEKHRETLSSRARLEEALSKGLCAGAANRDPVLCLVLSLLCCNSVELVDGKYQGSSQDEICMVEELARHGLHLKKRTLHAVAIELQGCTLEIEIPIVLEFTSARQRMSVVARVFGRHLLFTKGSDQKILRADAMGHVRRIIDRNSEFRSLAVCCREVGAAEFEDALRDYRGAIENHAMNRIDDIFERLEKDMVYLGTTFIEDKLQDHVGETVQSCLAAGIKIWMVTGDKKETAVSCAINCGLLDRDFERRGSGAVIYAEDLLSNAERFGELMFCKSVVVFRASPDHKARIAEGVMRTGKMTLSIGDGNNDVIMLQTTHIGVGIRGKEGTRACLTADISVPEFRCLERLLHVHGRNSYANLATVGLNSFYKNLFLILIQFYYDFFNGFSGNPVYNYYFLNYFNVFFTSLIPLAVGVFNRQYPDEYLLENPKRYRETRCCFTNKVFLLMIVYAISKATLVFWITYGIVIKKDITSPQGYVGGYKALNNFFSFVVFFSVVLRQVGDITFYVVYSYVAIAVSVLAYVCTIFGLQEIDYYQRLAVPNLYSTPVFYMAAVCVVSLAFFADCIYESVLRRFIQRGLKE
ncbi:UNVERIFIED_CONTAM: hypothetical protein PYX00_010819 [Menopon gallinae]|uniref:P-type phospholipid transporter n=1 Tax=Menopon gallinae TaxID=328185 RepID=A0AAW2H6Q7_9NEOP